MTKTASPSVARVVHAAPSRGPRAAQALRTPVLSAKAHNLLSRDQAAEALGVCRRSIDNYIRSRHLKVTRRRTHGLRTRTFIAASEIERFQRDLVTDWE